MSKNKRLYIAYGSNLDMDQMLWRCPGAKLVAKSWLYDHKLVFQGMPSNAHANVIPAEGYDVPVGVWEIDRYDEMSLDRYEGVRGGYYTKEIMQVEVHGKLVDALIYIMTPHDYGVPSDSYLRTVARGYRDFNFDVRILNSAVKEAYQKTPHTLAAI